MEVWPYGDIELIRKKVDPQYHDVVDLMQRARIEMKALQQFPNPNTKSIIDMRAAQNINAFFKALKVKGQNSSHLIVNDELVIDAKAFLQMTQKDRDTLIEETRKFKTIEDSDTIKLSGDASLVCNKYRLMFEKQRRDRILRILTAFQVRSREELTFGKIQFEKLEQYDVDRVIAVFRESGKNYNEKYSEVIRKMADRFQVDNVPDFVAVAEYAARRMSEEIKSIQQKNPNPPGKPQGMKVVEYYLERVAEKFFINKNGFLDNIYDVFEKLRADCAKYYPENGLRFETLMAAANHYDKHFRKLQKILNEPVTPEKYFEIATELCSNPEGSPKWTQDGSFVFWQIRRPDGTFAVRHDNPYKGTSVISTLHVPSVRRQ